MAKLRRRDYLFSFFRISMALGIALVISQIPMQQWEFASYDAYFRILPNKSPSTQIAILGIDEESLSVLSREPNATELLNSLQELYYQGAKKVLLFIDLKKVRGSFRERERLAKFLVEEDVWVAIEKLRVDSNEKEFQLPMPYQKVKTFPAILSADKVNFAGDGVSRRALLSFEEHLFLHTEVALYEGSITKQEDLPGLFAFKGSKQIFVQNYTKDSYVYHSWLEAYQASPLAVENKYVLMGYHRLYEASDFLQSVYSRDVVAMSKLHYNANILQTLFDRSSIQQAPKYLIYLMTLIFSLLSVLCTYRFRPLRAIAYIFLTAISLCVFSLLSFHTLHYWIPVVHPLLALFVSYYFFIPYRLITENKKSWEYQQKNQLLLQVEELKNNFISMMSHDLKTPIARIQGMADVALSMDSEAEKKKALETIKDSTRELNVFINSVLHLSRVESDGISLNLESRDLNAIVEECIESCQYLAKQKNIDILFEPEPLFSLKLDSTLMKQVVHNLIENAIKYSPENTKVLITTEEIEGEVVLQVADQGLGISQDEVEKIFYKFYRSKDVKASKIKGTGLGLYLSDYFVKLHSGKIEVESVESQGSTFSVHLPIQ